MTPDHPDAAAARLAADETRAAWERYWRAGALHSCATSFSGNYDGPMGGFWRVVYAGLAPGDAVLDVASGNGALPRLLLDTRTEPSITCDAIDLAPVSPDWPQALPAGDRARVRFHGNTQAESLPFVDGSFSLAVSQFGLEYTDLASSVPELLRVLRRPALVALVVHHADSRLVEMAVEERSHVAWFLQPGGLHDCTLRLLPLMARAATPGGRAELAADPEAADVRATFNRWQRELSARAERSPCPDLLHELRDAIIAAVQAAPAHGEAVAAAQMGAARRAVTDNDLRLADLCRVARDKAGLDEMLALFGPAARQSVEPLRQGGHLVGWAVRMRLD